MRVRDKSRSMKAICGGAAWLALFFAIGCSPAVRKTVTAGESAATIEPVEPPDAIGEVAEDPGGFTITQQVTGTEDGRADDEAADAVRVEGRAGGEHHEVCAPGFSGVGVGDGGGGPGLVCRSGQHLYLARVVTIAHR